MYLEAIAPAIRQDIRYADPRNFMGRPVHGYHAARCILTRPAAVALLQVQQQLEKQHLRLVVYDCYRPQGAVDDFVAWTLQPDDAESKRLFYPNVSKSQLIGQGYIADKSGHSRGSTVDLTLIADPAPMAMPNPAVMHGNCTQPDRFPLWDGTLNMGTAFDCFDPLSHTDSPAISSSIRQNRQMLKHMMAEHGFRNLPEEWWHYTLVDEPHPNQTFHFPVE